MNFPPKARYLWSTHSACYNPANRLKMQEMAVLEGLDFKNLRGSIPPDPPSLRMSVVISPPLQNARSAIPVYTKKYKLLKPTRLMRRRIYSTWKIKFPSKAQYIWSAHSACYTCLWSRKAGNGCFRRSRFQNFPGGGKGGACPRTALGARACRRSAPSLLIS